MSKLNQKTITSAGVATVSALAGGMASRVIADNVPLFKDKPVYKAAILGVAAVVGAALITPKDDTTKALQFVLYGAGAAQLNETAKLALSSKQPLKEGVLKTALGAPDTEYVLVDNTMYPAEQTQDVDYQEVLDNPFPDNAPRFLAQPEFAAV